MTLPEALTLSEDEVSNALQRSVAQPPVIMPVAGRASVPALAPSTSHTCYTPETPGTPPTIIPGTPAIGDVPGTPDVVIPGTPSIQGTPYPCD